MPALVRFALALALLFGHTLAAQNDEDLPVLLAALHSSQPRDQSLEEQVNEAIERGVEFLKTQGGAFEAHGDYADGMAGLHLLTLLKCGVRFSDPEVEKCMAFLRYAPYTKTYCTGVRLMALDELGRRDPGHSYETEITNGAQWLVDGFGGAFDLWAYDHETLKAGGADLSNTQYAVLGLQTAVNHGFSVPESLWKRLSQAVMSLQDESGAFRYLIGGEVSGSMTAAGLFVLTVCLENLDESGSRSRRIRKSLQNGWDYLARRFDPRGNPVGQQSFSAQYHFYYLYGLERACVFGSLDTLGEHDWYREGARYLVKTQEPSGGWTGGTYFALLFLRKASLTLRGASSGPGGAGSSLADEASVALDRPLPPKGGVPFLRHWLIAGPWEDDDETGLRTAFLDEEGSNPSKGDVVRGSRWTLHSSPHDRIDLLQACKAEEHVVAYAFTRLQVEKDADAVLWVGSDDGIRIWVDGGIVLDRPFRRSYHGPFPAEGPDAHAVPIRLAGGVHRLLVKVTNFDEDWGFTARLCRRDGTPLPGLIAFTDSDGPSKEDRLAARASSSSLTELFEMMSTDTRGRCGFGTSRDIKRVLIIGAPADRQTTWVDEPEDLVGVRPPTGGVGFVQAAIPVSPGRLWVVRKVRPSGKRFRILARVAALDSESGTLGGWTGRLGFYDGETTWFKRHSIVQTARKDEAGWIELEATVKDHVGREVLIVLECRLPTTGPTQARAFLDDFSIR